MKILRDQRGAAALEAALVFPLYLAVILGVVELGNVYWTFNSVQYLADELSRCYAVGSCTDANRGASAFDSAANIWPSASAAANEITATRTVCGSSSGAGVRVTIVHSMASSPGFLVGGFVDPERFGFAPWPFGQIAAQSCYPTPN